MISNQQLLDHCKSYFTNRLNNHNGRAGSGWGHPGDNSGFTRCALGSLISPELVCVKEEVENLFQIGKYTTWPPNGIHVRIVHFNDYNISKDSLTIDKINLFLSRLAIDYYLDYTLINQAEEVKCTQNIE